MSNIQFLTKKEINKRLIGTGLKFISDYKGIDKSIKVLCFCGKDFYSTPYSIFKKHRVSCGCKRRLNINSVKKRYKNVGLELLDEYTRCDIKHKTRCICGNVFYVKPSNVFNRTTLSCGCITSPNLEGEKYGMLTLIKKRDNIRRGQVTYDCLCDCGKILYNAVAGDLKCGNTSSCGCLVYRNGKNSTRWKGHEDISSHFWTSLKRNANRKSRTLEFNITIEYIWDLFLKQNKKCCFTGIELDLGIVHDRQRTASLDRIDSSKGYIKGNVQWVHKKINVMKKAMSDEEFIGWCEKIVKYNKRKK